MWYVGLDAHEKYWVLCVLDENGKEVFIRKIRGYWTTLKEALPAIPRPFAVCFEASTAYGLLFDELSKLANRVLVAHPGQLRLIFRCKAKNDRVDAQKLAKLLFLDQVPVVHVPCLDMRSWRAAIEYRHRLVGERTRIKNSIRALLRTYGLAAPRGLWSKKGLAWLQGLSFANVLTAFQRDSLVERLTSHNKLIRTAEKALATEAARQPGVALLETIPGVGIRTAEAAVAYIDQPGRFHKSKAIGRYIGLVPCQDASGSVNRLGHITKEGPSTLRKLLTEAAWQGIRRSGRIRGFYERICQGNPQRRKIALVATAHYLIRVMLSMLKTGEVWRKESA